MDDQTPQGDHPSSGLEAKGMEAIRSAPFFVRVRGSPGAQGGQCCLHIDAEFISVQVIRVGGG